MHPGKHLAVGLVVCLSALGASADTPFSPLKPPAIPLAVRSPYLSTWLNGDSGGYLAGSWPRFWANEVTSWQGLVRVDGVTYNWMGGAQGPAIAAQTAFNYTSTKSVFTFDVDGKVSLTATFLSPVYPDDLLRQSLQFSYLHVSVASIDGNPHNTQIYSDISGEWASSNKNQTIDWDYTEDNSVAYHQFSLSQQAVFVEASDMAQWGTWFFSTGSGVGLTSQTGSSDNATRAQFIDKGGLNNTKDVNYRAIGDSRPVFAFSQDLGSLNGTGKDALFVIGVAQEQVINFRGASDSTEALAALWTTKYGSAQDAVAAFYQDWETAAEEGASLDAQIQSDSEKAGGSNYAALTTLAVRQVFGALQVAHGSSQDYVFLKEISSDGDCSTVDVVFPAHPILLYLNSTLLKLLLDPLFENQESGHYPNPWSIHDLGVFPNALGYAAGNDEAMPVEECGNMIIMTLAYAQRSHDYSYLAKHWPLLNQWAQFLVNDSLIPDNQLSTDDFAGTLANQTNLALKGIIGIGAMSEIANLSGVAAASSYITTYQNTAQDYIKKWASYGIAAEENPPHTTLTYGQNGTHGLLYNLYTDRLLGLNLVPQSIYDMQSDFYQTVTLDFGLSLDTRHTWAKADWEVFAAAIAKPDTQSLILERLIHFVEATQSNRPLTDLYDATTGNFPVDGPSFMARPVMGGTFALLALPN